MTAEPLRVAIVGYGIAGIAAAIRLRQAGHAVQHFERLAAAHSSGAGLLLHPPTLRLLQELGLLDAATRRGSRVECISGETAGGRRLMDLRYAEYQADCFGLGIQRAALTELLSGADPGRKQVHFDHGMIVADPDRGYLLDQDRRRHGPFDIIVLADGANSLFRQQLGIVRHDRKYPWAALVGLVGDPDRQIGARISQCFDGTDHVSYWPVGSRAPGAPHLINLSIKVPLADTGPGSTLGRWKRRIARLSPTLEPLLRRAGDDTPMLAYRYRDVVLRRYALGRLVFLGDAAHSMSPQLGLGVHMALQDAQVLAEALHERGNPAEALAEFDRHRRPHLGRFQDWSRWLTPLFQSDSRLLASMRDRISAPMMRSQRIRRGILKLLCEAHGETGAR
jgi:2-polyprenyl-6-methoxyphenol hydroxylase-like FAD-dependent oxidoreductase